MALFFILYPAHNLLETKPNTLDLMFAVRRR
jgi:hypothetical protein